MSATGNEAVKLSQLKGTTDAIKSSINNVLQVAQGKTKTYVIANQSAITGTKASDGSYTNVSAITGITMSDLAIGDIILIVDTEVPDLWVSQITPSYTLSKLETTKVDLTDYATTTQLNTKLTGTKYNSSNPDTFIGYNHESNTSPTYFASFKNNDASNGLTYSPVSSLNIPTSVNGLSGGTISSKVIVNNSSDTPLEVNGNSSSANYIAFKSNGALSGYIGVNSSQKPVFYDSSEKQIALISDIGNPNLLINSDFRINQRGLTTYTSSKYSVDRWYLSYGNLSVTSEGITHTSTNTWQGILQRLENPEKYAGKTLTLSARVKCASGSNCYLYIYSQKSGASRVTVANTSTTSTSYTTISCSGTIPSDITSADGVYVMIQTSQASNTFYVNWAKLEMGSVATTYTPPLTAEELPKCQRYYHKIAVHGGAVSASTGTQIYPALPLATTMRTNPTISIVTYPHIRGGGITSYTLTSSDTISLNTLYSSSIRLGVTLNTSMLTGGTIYCLANGLIELDAEMY